MDNVKKYEEEDYNKKYSKEWDETKKNCQLSNAIQK